MKLSEAIRLGEFALPPVHGKWIEYKGKQPCGACAVGRTCYAAGYIPKHKGSEEMYALTWFMDNTWPWVINKKVVFPVAKKNFRNPSFMYIHLDFINGVGRQVLGMMSDLYECERWSIQQIAQWIETIEPVEATSTDLLEVEQESTVQVVT